MSSYDFAKVISKTQNFGYVPKETFAKTFENHENNLNLLVYIPPIPNKNKNEG